MWSLSNAHRNRISPVQHRQQNGYSHASDWDEPREQSPRYTPQSSSGVHINMVNGTPRDSANALTKFIRKRKYDKKTMNIDNFFKRHDGQRWTPSLTQRLQKKQIAQKAEGNSNVIDDHRTGPIKEVRELWHSLNVWGAWFKRIEGHQGTGVLSYFVFLKWMFFLDIYIYLLVFGFIVIPPIAFSEESNYTAPIKSQVGTDTTDVDACSLNYSLSIEKSSGAEEVIQDFLQGTGWMEETALFYGWYPAKELNLHGNRNYLMPFGYFMTVLGVLFLSIIKIAINSINVNEVDTSIVAEYCNKVFVGWDYGLHELDSCDLKKKSIYKDIAGHLSDQRHLFARLTWTTGQKCTIYSIRFLVNYIIILFLGGAGALIYYVNECSTDYLSDRPPSGNVKLLAVQFLPSVTITLLNVILPLLFGVLVKFEDYTENGVIVITLIRTVFLRFASVAVLIASLYSSIECTKNDEGDFKSCPDLKCWETYVGQSFYKLIVVDFFVHLLAVMAYELPRKLITTKCSSKILSKIGPAEFDVPQSVLDQIYTQSLCWIGLLFCPLISSIAVFSFAIRFYLKLFSALYTTVPPERPYKAARTNTVYMIILMAVFLFCCIPVGYSMIKIQPSKGCGPFRIYSEMSVCVDATIENFPCWLENIIDIFKSTVFVLTLLVLLCSVIYYLAVRAATNGRRAERLREQLLLEIKDKQYLLVKMNQTSGNSKRKPKPSVQPHDNYPSEDFHDQTRKFIDGSIPGPSFYEESGSRQQLVGNTDWDEPVESPSNLDPDKTRDKSIRKKKSRRKKKSKTYSRENTINTRDLESDMGFV